MRIRTQLILAFLLLSIVPLTGIVLYSYVASQGAVRRAIAADAVALTRDMEGRMTAIRDDLGKSMERLGRLPLAKLVQSDRPMEGGGDPALMARILGAIGNAAPLVESLEIMPGSARSAESARSVPDAGAAAAAAAGRRPQGKSRPRRTAPASHPADRLAELQPPPARALPRLPPGPQTAAPGPPPPPDSQGAAPGLAGPDAARLDGAAGGAPEAPAGPGTGAAPHFRGAAPAQRRMVVIDLRKLLQSVAGQSGLSAAQTRQIAAQIKEAQLEAVAAYNRSLPRREERVARALEMARKQVRAGRGIDPSPALPGAPVAAPPGAPSNIAGRAPAARDALSPSQPDSLAAAASPTAPARPPAPASPSATVPPATGPSPVMAAPVSPASPAVAGVPELPAAPAAPGSPAASASAWSASPAASAAAAASAPGAARPSAPQLVKIEAALDDAGVAATPGGTEGKSSARRARRLAGHGGPSPGVPPAAAPARQGEAQVLSAGASTSGRSSQETELKRVRAANESEMLLGRTFEVPVADDGGMICHVKAQVSGLEVVHRVLARTRRDAGEVPFAVDTRGTLYTVDREDQGKLAGLPLAGLARGESAAGRHVVGDWVVVTSRDPSCGLTFGIARPFGKPLQEVRRTAARNFGYGMSLIGLALLGILPLSERMTRRLKVVTAGAERIAKGDLETRVPVDSRNEFGQLAMAFNRMAEDLRDNQRRLVESGIEQRLLQTEYDRKTRELEEARRFQLSLLPKVLPVDSSFTIAVSMQTATEVGGDYYDFHLGEDGRLTAVIGDATGHGATAGTMVTVIKSLFSSYSAATTLSAFLTEAGAAIRRMELGRMAMALALVRLEAGELCVASAGMPPVLLYRRATGQVEELALPAMPLGGIPCSYLERRLAIAPGDTILLLSDGFPELQDPSGEPLGYPRVQAHFAASGGKPPDDLLADLVAAASAWSGHQPPADDVTFVAIQVRRA
ncbi:MAG TPA: SpoIIE family protein phosphatase [Thermoanaerobaculia bacterium]|nr:SpoIIE family protein phosphatase [Thermoanaerobaculia bacterium]